MLVDFSVGLIISLAVNWLARPILQRAGWVDMPSERKLHARPTIISGGLALFCALTIGTALLHFEATYFGLYLSAVAIMFIAGFLDDRAPIRARYRFLVQVVASFALVVGTNAVIQTFPLASKFDLATVPALPTFLSIFFMVGLINAINMSDGSDGVASGYGVIAILGVLAFVLLGGSNPTVSSPVAITTTLLMLGGLVAFLFFNYPIVKGRPALAFMGDGGSMLLGIVVGWTLLKAGMPTGAKPLSFWYAIWLVALPTFDATYCILRRLLSGKDPLSPDRRHLHHLLQGYRFSSRSLALTVHAAATVFALIGILFWFHSVPVHVAGWLFVLTIVGYAWVASRAWDHLDGREHLRQGVRSRIPAGTK